MKKLVLLSILLIQTGLAQPGYHGQRVSLFEELPGDPTDIIFLGNSITDGGEWAELFQDLRVKNRGISGDETPGVLNRLGTILEQHPAKLFLMIGINDLASGRGVPEIAANLDSILSRIQRGSPGTLVFLQSVLPVNPTFGAFPNHTNKSREISQLNWQLRRLAHLHHVEYIDLWSDFQDAAGFLDSSCTNDGLHLTGTGYQRWAKIIREKVFE